MASYTSLEIFIDAAVGAFGSFIRVCEGFIFFSLAL